MLLQTCFANQLTSKGGGFAHGQVVAYAGRRDGLLGAIRMDEHIRYRAKNIRAELQCQAVIHEDSELGGLGHGEAAVVRKRATGAAHIRMWSVVQRRQFLVFRQRPHGAIAFHDLRYQGSFAGANNGNAHLAAANGLNPFSRLKVYRRRSASGGADGVQHIGIEKVGGHFAQAQRNLFGGDALAVGREAHDAAQAVVIHL